MIRRALVFSISIGAALPALAADPSNAAPVVRQFVLQGPMIVAFLPESQRSRDDVRLPSATAYATKALGRVKMCLGARAVSYRLVYADQIVIHDMDGHDETYEISDSAPLPGALLLNPDANTRIVFAGGGPQALVPLLRKAAAEYFDIPCRG